MRAEVPKIAQTQTTTDVTGLRPATPLFIFFWERMLYIQEFYKSHETCVALLTGVSVHEVSSQYVHDTSFNHGSFVVWHARKNTQNSTGFSEEFAQAVGVEKRKNCLMTPWTESAEV